MDTIIIPVQRKIKASEKMLRGIMIALAVLFLLQGILLSRSFMLPCLLMAGLAIWYSVTIRREFEYILEEGWIRIYRVNDRGRFLQHEFSMEDIVALATPEDPAVAAYRKGGSEKIRKFDYTSYQENVPYYTMIVAKDGTRIKLLLDLTREAIERIRRANRTAVHC